MDISTRLSKIADVYETILGELPDAMLMLDENRDICYANIAALRLFQKKGRPIIGENFGHAIARDEEGVPVEVLTNSGVIVGSMRTAEQEIDGEKFTLVTLRDVTETVSLRRQYASMLVSAIMALSRTIELRDPYTSGHESRVAVLARAIAIKLGYEEDFQTGIYIAGQLHDIGKISIPSAILTKPGKLFPEEMHLVRLHVTSSYDILKNIEFPWPVAEAAYQHHERKDGSGYPRQLRGAEIIREARILMVADTVEAMLTDRPYRFNLGKDAALAEIRSGAGTLYFGDVCEACLDLFENDGFDLDDQTDDFDLARALI